MSEHLSPDKSDVRPLPAGRRLKSLDEFTPPEWRGRMRRVERQLPAGAKAGLVLVAAACLGLAIGLYAAFGPAEIVAEGVERSR